MNDVYLFWPKDITTPSPKLTTTPTTSYITCCTSLFSNQPQVASAFNRPTVVAVMRTDAETRRHIDS